MTSNNVDPQVLKYRTVNLRLLKPILQDDSQTLATHRKYSQDTTTTTDFAVKYKTQKCRYWNTLGECPFGQTVITQGLNQCAFAHGNIQIRSKLHTSRNYKTKLCINFSTTGACRYGERCQFKHETKQGKKIKNTSGVNTAVPQSYSKLLNELSDPLTSCPVSRRLKIFADFQLDTFETVDWKYKKPRTYTL